MRILVALLLLSCFTGCGDPFDPDSALARSYLESMDQVTLTPRGASDSSPTGSLSSSPGAAGEPGGGSLEDASGDPIETGIELILPSIQIDLQPAPETAEPSDPAHVFSVQTQVVELRVVTDVREASLDLRLIKRRIGITDILRYLHIDEKAVLEDLRMQLQNQLREIFLRSFRLKLLRHTGPDSSTHAPTESKFECVFHKHGFSGSELAGPPVSCSAEISFDAPIDSLRVSLRGP